MLDIDVMNRDDESWRSGCVLAHDEFWGIATVFIHELSVRSFVADHDRDAVLALVNADRMQGQPECTSEMLDQALAGRSPVDSGWWEELADLRVEVVESAGGVVGVVSYAVRPRDSCGIVLWLHGREDQAVVAMLVDRAMDWLGECPVVEAFDFASALGLGLEGLPVAHRPATHAALVGRGFADADLWRYMYRALPAPDLPRTAAFQVEQIDGDRRQLTVTAAGATLAEATIGLPVGGIGVLWWISVEPAARGGGVGRALLGSALDLLAGLGAAGVILFVDDDEPGGERDRVAANRLYEKTGFVEVDRLHSYRRVRVAAGDQVH
jgi:ribosomal protein S18 acetylase RimI-like enzyme